MIQLPGNNTEYTFTATADTLVQNKGNVPVSFQTDNNETIWGKLVSGMTLEVPDGITVYFKCDLPTDLATIEF